MKLLLPCLLQCAAALAQHPPDAGTITFSRTDAEHCRVIMVAGKPLLESSYRGISVAVGMPANMGNGEFSVFVSIYQTGPGAAHVVPKDFSAVFSDSAHTRFFFFDKGAEARSNLAAQPPSSGVSAETNQIDRSLIRGGPAGPGAAGRSPSDTLKGDNPPPNLAPGASPEEKETTGTLVFLEAARLKQGSRIAGLVFFRKPKGSKLDVTSAGMLDEIDIPVNGILFRF